MFKYIFLFAITSVLGGIFYDEIKVIFTNNPISSIVIILILITVAFLYIFFEKKNSKDKISDKEPVKNSITKINKLFSIFNSGTINQGK